MNKCEPTDAKARAKADSVLRRWRCGDVDVDTLSIGDLRLISSTVPEYASKSSSEVAVIAATPGGSAEPWRRWSVVAVGVAMIPLLYFVASVMAWLFVLASLAGVFWFVQRVAPPLSITIDGGRLRATSISPFGFAVQVVDLAVDDVLCADVRWKPAPPDVYVPPGADDFQRNLGALHRAVDATRGWEPTVEIATTEGLITLDLRPYGRGGRAVARRLNNCLSLGAAGLRPSPEEVESQRRRFAGPSNQRTLHPSGADANSANTIVLGRDGMRLGREGSMRSLAWGEITAAHVVSSDVPCAVDLELANGDWLLIEASYGLLSSKLAEGGWIRIEPPYGLESSRLAELLAPRWYDDIGNGHGTAKQVEARMRRAELKRAGLLPKKKKRTEKVAEEGGGAPPDAGEPSTPAG